MLQLHRVLQFKRALTIALLFIPLTGCSIDEQTLESWRFSPSGTGKLGGYLVDPLRPDELRKKSALLLLDKRSFEMLLSAYESSPPEGRVYLGELYQGLIKSALRRGSLDEDGRRLGIDFAAILISFELTRSLIRDNDEIFTGLVEWSISRLKGTQRRRSSSDSEEEGEGEGAGEASSGAGSESGGEDDEESAHIINPRELLSVCAALREEEVSERLLREVRETPQLVSFAVIVNTILSAHQRPQFRHRTAEMLLLVARAALPNLSKGLVQAMKENGNLTLLRFLLDLPQDRRVSKEIRGEALFAALEQMCIEIRNRRCVSLPPEGREGLLRLISSPYVHRSHIFRALGYFWDVYGVEGLREVLFKLNTARFPVAGEELRGEVRGFCTQELRPRADQSLRIELQEIFDESIEDSEEWAASLYSLICLAEIFPDEFRELMNRSRLRKLQRSSVRISGWEPGRRISLRRIATDLLSTR